MSCVNLFLLLYTPLAMCISWIHLFVSYLVFINMNIVSFVLLSNNLDSITHVLMIGITDVNSCRYVIFMSCQSSNTRLNR